MPTAREQQFIDMINEFPDSPMGYFSLGKYYLDSKDYAGAQTCFTKAVGLDPNYTAAWVALGDANIELGLPDEAKAAFEKALATPHGQKDMSLQADVELRLREL